MDDIDIMWEVEDKQGCSWGRYETKLEADIAKSLYQDSVECFTPFIVKETAQ